MQISVIIPVYNAAAYLEKAVKSALFHEQVKEVLVVDDGSTDSSLALMRQLHQFDARVKVLQHEKGINRGRSASRNLGLKMATQPYIAFLDADDYYLPNRFDKDQELFFTNSNCDGVYNAIGAEFYTTTKAFELEAFKLYTVTEPIVPEALFETLLSGQKGHFSILGLTVKKAVFERVGFFNEALKVAEDTEMFWKMALLFHLYSGTIDEPVAVRGVHDTNSFDDLSLYKVYYIKMYASLISWSSKKGVPLSKIDLLLKWFWLLKSKEKRAFLHHICCWFYLFIPNIRILFSSLSLKYFPLIQQRKKIFSIFYKN